ncbi:hypothetical protein BH23CHL5_BH23CHL5_15780 [soil metagenome]
MTDNATRVENGPDAKGKISWVVPAVLALLLVIATGVAAWLWWDNLPPDNDSADAAFARDMTDHHAQAVEMALIVYQRSDDPDIQQMAYDIVNSQQAQIGMMTAWLNIWDLTTAREGAPMEWAAANSMAGHEMGNGEMQSVEDMPGMISREQIDSLRELEGAEMDLQFLVLMKEHHEGGILMAEAALEVADEDVVSNLANAIIISQTAEITNMINMIAEREGS